MRACSRRADDGSDLCGKGRALLLLALGAILRPFLAGGTIVSLFLGRFVRLFVTCGRNLLDEKVQAEVR